MNERGIQTMAVILDDVGRRRADCSRLEAACMQEQSPIHRHNGNGEPNAETRRLLAKALCTDGPNQPLRCHVCVLLLAARPVRTVAGAAVRCQTSRSTLSRQWKNATKVMRCPKLRDIIDMIALVHACELAENGLSWFRVAAEMTVTLKTLRHMAKRVHGRTLRAMRALGSRGATWTLVNRLAACKLIGLPPGNCRPPAI